MSVNAISRRVTAFGYKLLSLEFAMDARQHLVRKSSEHIEQLSWARDWSRPIGLGCPAGLADYFNLLESQDYSYLMADGGVVQIGLWFDRGEITGHRLHYFPCPFIVSPEDVGVFSGGLREYIDDTFSAAYEKHFVSRTPLRFDFDPSDAREYHPASHLTLNDPCCRIPARGPLSFDTFMKFLLENFYPDAWMHPEVRGMLAFEHESDCLSDHDLQRTYLTWSHR